PACGSWPRGGPARRARHRRGRAAGSQLLLVRVLVRERRAHDEPPLTEEQPGQGGTDAEQQGREDVADRGERTASAGDRVDVQREGRVRRPAAEQPDRGEGPQQGRARPGREPRDEDAHGQGAAEVDRERRPAPAGAGGGQGQSEQPPSGRAEGSAGHDRGAGPPFARGLRSGLGAHARLASRNSAIRPIASVSTSSSGSATRRKWSGSGQLKPVPWVTRIFFARNSSMTKASSSSMG